VIFKYAQFYLSLGKPDLSGKFGFHLITFRYSLIKSCLHLLIRLTFVNQSLQKSFLVRDFLLELLEVFPLLILD